MSIAESLQRLATPDHREKTRFAAEVQAFIRLEHFFPSSMSTNAIIHKSATALLQHSYGVPELNQTRLIESERAGKLGVTSGSFRSVMDQSVEYITKFMDYLFSYEITREGPMIFEGSWQKRFLN